MTPGGAVVVVTTVTTPAKTTKSTNTTTKTEPSSTTTTTKPSSTTTTTTGKVKYIANTNTKKFHYPDCYSVTRMKESNKWYFTGSRDELIALGYSPCGNCKP
jgi:DNA-entry nuclease